MKFLTIVCCALITIGLVQAEDTCTSSDGNVIKVGETFTNPGVCAIFTCGTGGSLSTKICALAPPVRSTDNYVYHPQDNSKPWPECCEKVVIKNS